MVARSPRMQHRRMAVAPSPLSPTLLRDTVKKVDKCMARLQELQHTVAGGRKVIYWVNQSSCSTRIKQESLRIKNANSQRSPGKLLTNTEEWKSMSLPTMLVGETMGEIMQASQFTRNIVQAVSSSTPLNNPKTPPSEGRKQRRTMEERSDLLHARRRREKQVVLQTIQSEPSIQNRAKSRINFKKSPQEMRGCDKENCRYVANRVSPRNRPWARKTVLFPNPLFNSSPTSPRNQKFSKTKSPVIARKSVEIPHKILIKSSPPPAAASKFQLKMKGHHPLLVSPKRPTTATLVGKSPKASNAAKLRRSFSPSRLANRLVSPMKNLKLVDKNEGGAARMRRSFSPSRVGNRLVSPLKSSKYEQKNVVSGLKQRPTSMSVQFSPRRR